MSANDADVRVRIAGDLSDIKRDLAALKKQAQDTSREAARGASQWNVLGKALDGLRANITGIVGAYLGFRGVQKLFGAIIDNTVEAERVAAQLEARVKSTGQVAGFTAEQLLQLAKDFQSVTSFGDEAIATAETLLLSFTNIRGDNFTKTTAAVLDMATALGTDLGSAATTVGKALNDPIKGLTALQRAGVQFSAQQRILIKQLVETGDVAGAQGVILDTLQKKFGGSAAAERDTFGGAIKALKESFGDLLEGKGGLPEARDAIESLIKLFKDPQTISAFGELTAAVLRSAAVLAQAVEKFTEVGRGLGIFIGQLATGTTDPTDSIDVLNAAIDRTKVELNEAQRAFNNFEPDTNGVIGGSTKEVELLTRRLKDLEFALEAAKRESQATPTPPPPSPNPATSVQPALVTPPTIAVDARPAIKAMQAQLDAASKLLAAQTKSVGAALEAQLQDNLIKFADYYKRRGELEQGALDNQIAAQREAVKLLDEQIKVAGNTGEDPSDEENKRKVLIAEITALEQQRADVATAAARQQALAERDLVDQLKTVRARLLDLQGDSIGARTAELHEEFKKLLERLQVEGDAAGIELVNKLINVEGAKVRLDKLQTEYEQTLGDLQRAEERVDLQVARGDLSERQGREQVLKLHQATAAQLELLLPMMRELAEATGDPAAIERLKDLELQVEQLGQHVNLAAAEMKKSIRSAGVDAFASFLDGTKKAGDAWDDFVQNIRTKVAQLAAEKLFDKLFGSLSTTTSSSSGGGNLGGFAQFFASLFHQGGIVGAPGIPQRAVPLLALAGPPRPRRYHEGGLVGGEELAILKRGEEVLTRKDPRHRANGGREGGTTINIATSNAQSFRRASPGQLAADAATMLARAKNRNG